MQPSLLAVTLVAASAAFGAHADTLLLNGNFESTAVTTLANGFRQYEGWTETSSAGFIWLEGTNGPSSFDIRSTRFDGGGSPAPDPYFPFQSESDSRLDYMGAVRPGISSFGSLVSTAFALGASISLDAWRESTDAISVVNVIRASDNSVLKTLTISSPGQQWAHFTIDTSSFSGTQSFVELRGGTPPASE
jgi:hypothetical protein